MIKGYALFIYLGRGVPEQQSLCKLTPGSKGQEKAISGGNLYNCQGGKHELHFSQNLHTPFPPPYNLSFSWKKISKGLSEGWEGFIAKALKCH